MGFKMPLPRVTCADGTSVSIQASRFTYCQPRNDVGPYVAVEVGFPSIDPGEDWREYQEDPDKPLETVYGYVPVTLVRAFLDAHGGVSADQALPLGVREVERES